VSDDVAEERYHDGYDTGYQHGVDEYRDRYHEAAEAADKAIEMLKVAERHYVQLVEWLNHHYPNVVNEFEISTAVAQRMEGS
jgi:hypothetical protein